MKSAIVFVVEECEMKLIVKNCNRLDVAARKQIPILSYRNDAIDQGIDEQCRMNRNQVRDRALERVL